MSELTCDVIDIDIWFTDTGRDDIGTTEEVIVYSDDGIDPNDPSEVAEQAIHCIPGNTATMRFQTPDGKLHTVSYRREGNGFTLNW